MEEQGLKEFVGNVSVALVIFLFALGFWLYDKRKKQKERKENVLAKLKSGKVFVIHSLDIPYSEHIEAKLKNWASQRNGRVIYLDGTEGLIVFLNERGKSQFKGFLNVASEDLPMRLVLYNDGGMVSLRLDEDWGFQLFIGPAKTSFKTRYIDQMNRTLKLIENL